MTRWIAGLDGCRGGWAAALMDLDDPERFSVRRLECVAAALDGAEQPLVLAIDIPIGLPERVAGGRTADRAARRLLGRGASSVFPVPARAAVYAPDYATAKGLARDTSQPPRAVSIQCFNIFPAIREVDRLLRERPASRPRVFEAHPEVAFHQLNGGRTLAAPKRHPAGHAARRALLLAAGLPPRLVDHPRPSGVGRDDHLDALAALVVARAIAQGRAVSLPQVHEHDAHGLPIAIWAPAGPIEP